MPEIPPLAYAKKIAQGRSEKWTSVSPCPQGSNTGGKLDIRVTGQYELNLITGKVTRQTEEWDASGCEEGSYKRSLSNLGTARGPRRERELSDGLLGGQGDIELNSVELKERTM